MKVIEHTRRSAVAVEVDAPISDVARTMEAAAVGAVAVLDGGALVGIVTDRDLVRRALAHRLDPAARVDGVMSSPVVTIAATADIREAFPLFAEHAIRRLAIVDERGSFVGVLSADDVLMNLSADLQAVVRPVAAEVLFGHRDAEVPALTGEGGTPR
jgi:CBS domain-containing protein